MKGALSTALGFGAATLALGGFGSALSLVKGGAIDMNAQLETSTLQFETLMGDSDRAKKHVESLFDFAAKTPFETEPIIKASRIMQTFGGDALNSKDNLTLFGDAAAAVSAPIDDIAFWMSRAYAAIEGGQPFGEARMRLMELGVITPQVASKLQELSDSGADSTEVWGALQSEVGKFGGAMEKQSKTFDGMVSTFIDGVNIMLAKALKPLFDGLKGLLGGINDFMSTDMFNGTIEAIGSGISRTFGLIADAIGAVAEVVGPIVSQISDFISLLAGGGGALDGFASSLDSIHEAILGALQGAIDWVLNEGVPMAAQALDQMAQAFIEWVGPAAEQLGAALPLIAENVINFLATNLPVIAGKLLEWAGAFLGWVSENVLPRLPGILATVGGAIIGWIVQTAPIVAQRMFKMAQMMLGEFGKVLPKLPAKMGEFLGFVLGKIIEHAPGIIVEMGKMALGLVTEFLKFVATLPGKFLDFMGQVIRSLPGIGINLAKGALGAAGDFVRGFIKGMANFPAQLIKKIQDAFRNIRIDIGPFHISASGVRIDLPDIKLPGFATGAYNLPHDMIAQVHKGEMIIPADLASRLRGGQGFASPSGGGGGGTTAVTVYIGTFYGHDPDAADELSENIARRVRAATVRRN